MSRLRQLTHFVAENAKSLRAVLKAIGYPFPIRSAVIGELNEHTPAQEFARLLEPARRGVDLGIVSEAGCPAVADPGSVLVALAHEEGLRIVPMVGPSSILLALMASGFNGQRFAFHGYPPVKEPARTHTLRALEDDSRLHQCVQIFIETPYRNEATLQAVLAVCAPSTQLCLAVDLTSQNEWIATAAVRSWRGGRQRPNLDRRPAVFLLQAT